MADFQKCLISPIFGVFTTRFYSENNCAVVVEWVFACFWHFQFLTQTDHFAKAIAFAWAIAFGRWSIFKIVFFFQYLVVFRAVFCTEQVCCCWKMVFRMFLVFLIFDVS